MKNNKFICYPKKTDEQGRTMVEMLGVLAIMGLITYAAVAVINQGITSYKITQTYNEIQEIARGVEDLYSWSEDYTGLSVKNLCENDIFPGGCTTGETPEGIGQFGKGITVKPCDGTLCGGIATTSLFAILYPIGPDSDTYTRLASFNWCESGLYMKKLNSTIVVRPLTSADTVGSNCSEAEPS